MRYRNEDWTWGRCAGRACSAAFPRDRVAFGFSATSPAHGREIVARLANAYRLSPGGGEHDDRN